MKTLVSFDRKSSDPLNVKNKKIKKDKTWTKEGCIMVAVLFAQYLSIILQYAFTDLEIGIKSSDPWYLKNKSQHQKKLCYCYILTLDRAVNQELHLCR